MSNVEKNEPRTFGRASLEWFRQERDETDKAIERLRSTGSAEGMKGTSIEAGILSAQSNRELAAATITATEILDSSIKLLDAQIRIFTTKADRGTNRLAKWTMVLAIVTGLLVLAAFAQAWVMWSVAP